MLLPEVCNWLEKRDWTIECYKVILILILIRLISIEISLISLGIPNFSLFVCWPPHVSSEKKNVHCFSMSTVSGEVTVKYGSALAHQVGCHKWLNYVRSYLFYKSNVEGENGIIDKSNIYFLSYLLNVQIEKNIYFSLNMTYNSDPNPCFHWTNVELSISTVSVIFFIYFALSSKISINTLNPTFVCWCCSPDLVATCCHLHFLANTFDLWLSKHHKAHPKWCG